MTANSQPSLASGFWRSAQRFGARPALMVDGQTLTYEVLAGHVARLVAAIEDEDPGDSPLVAVLAHRSRTAFAGVLAALSAGRGYVPLNPKFPVERLRRVLELSGTRILIAGSEAYAQLASLLGSVSTPLTVLLPDEAPLVAVGDVMPHRLVPVERPRRRAAISAPRPVAPDGLAYLLFTSGSTGEPKGVPITHASARTYTRAICERSGIDEFDRVSQMSDLTFDWSVHDLYPCWERGAALFCVPESAHFAPAKFIRDHRLTVWASVPSVISFMQRMRTLKPGSLASIRYSAFCGEPLLASHAAAWQQAAPNAVVDNVYGPTEATVAITGYRWDPVRSPAESESGIVPIGWPFPGQRCAVVDDAGRAVERGAPGELCLAGSQVAAGYWNNPEQTAARFVTLPGAEPETRWYRTGDLVRERDDGCLTFIGRVDNQVKVRGYRVELHEIDAVLRAAAGVDAVATIAWPVAGGSAEGVVSFIAGRGDRDEQPIVALCRQRLPDYMVPRRILFLDTLPLNANGKVDRKQLVTILQEVSP